MDYAQIRRLAFILSASAGVGSALVSVRNAQAQTPAVTLGNAISSVSLNHPANYGFEFTATTGQTVTALGRGPVADAMVSLYDVTAKTLLASALPSSGAFTQNGFTYTNIAPITLQAGRNYAIESVIGYPRDSSDFNTYSASYTNNYSTAPGISVVRSVQGAFRWQDYGATEVGFVAPGINVLSTANFLTGPLVTPNANSIDFSFSLGAFSAVDGGFNGSSGYNTSVTTSGNPRTLHLTSSVTVQDVVIGDIGATTVLAFNPTASNTLVRSLTYSINGLPETTTTMSQNYGIGRSSFGVIGLYSLGVTGKQVVYDLGANVGTITINYRSASASRTTGTNSGYMQTPLLADFTFNAVTAAPEPGTIALLVVGGTALSLNLRRRKF